jgi:processive 1,2-diacylglycerol beta-glucosyltransferase
MTRVLILTAGFGEGHNAAARNLAAAVDAAGGAGTAQIADLFALASPRLNHLTRRGYLTLINRAPRLWSTCYGWADRPGTFPRHLWFLRKELRALARLLEREPPRAVCSTFPVYGFLAERLNQRGVLRAPHFNIVTDSISINSLWTRPACAGWFVPNSETAEVVRRLGVPANRLHEYGFPVQRFFAENAGRLAPPDLATGASPAVLYIIHSGVRSAEATAGALLARTDWSLTFAVGRDKRLRHRLEKAAAGRAHPTAILSWTDQIPRLLMTHHAVISKAGGATTQEAIAAHCPMVVNQIVPGQEEGNYELLRRRGAGAYAATPDAVLDALHGAFAGRGELWRQWRTALVPLARLDAARDIARQVLNGATPAL